MIGRRNAVRVLSESRVACVGRIVNENGLGTREVMHQGPRRILGTPHVTPVVESLLVE